MLGQAPVSHCGTNINEQAYPHFDSVIICPTGTPSQACFQYFSQQLPRIIPACLKERQRSRLTTLECLEAQCDPVFEIKVAARGKARHLA